LPELNAVELEAQLATDSSNLIAAKSTFDVNVLTLKAAMNLDPAAPFEVDTPPVDQIPVDALADLQPDVVYQLALTNQPLQRENQLKIKGAQKNIDATKAWMYPSLTGFYSLASTYNNQAQEVVGSQTINPQLGKVTIAGTDFPVYPTQPYQQNVYGKSKYLSQIDNNFSQAIGIGLTIPIFNNGTYRINYEQSKLNMKSLQLQDEQANITLKQDIYTSYANAIASMQKYFADFKTVNNAQKAYDFSKQRYDVGLLATIDLITNQNNLLKAKLQQLADHYDYVFKMKLLEFYKGQGLKL
jgi:outer membrane protein